MTQPIITDSQLSVLEALAVYRYLTAQQCVGLGISKNIKSLRTNILNRMADRSRPWIIKKNFGQELPGQGGRQPFVYCLTERGAEIVSDYWRVPFGKIIYPKGGIQFARDLQHRIATIDCHVQMRRWAEAIHGDVVHADWYFDKTGSQRAAGYQHATSRLNLSSSGGDWIEPDGVFGVNVEGVSVLYVLEVHRFPDTGRIVQQLLQHGHVLANGTASKKYNLDCSHMVLSVHVNEVTFRKARQNLLTYPGFSQFSESYVFARLDDVKADISSAWVYANGQPAGPFPN